MKILVTGAAGFIGSNLSMKLLKEGHTVIGVDNFSYGEHRNIHEISENKRFTLLNRNLADSDSLKDLKADIIVHLASQKIPRYTNALRTLEENSQMLRQVIKKGIEDKCKIVFTSTSDVYGKNTKLPFKEDSDLVLGPTNVPRWSYAVSKIYGEQLLVANHHEYGLKYTIVRLFGSYGINQNLSWWGGPQSVFIKQALNNELIEIHGDGKQTRTFTYIDDTINALMYCIFHEKAENDIFNIASNPNEEISIIDLGTMIWQIIHGLKNKPNFNFIPYSNFGNYEDVRRRVPDITKLEDFFGYSPKINLKEGLTKTINWQKTIELT